MFKRLFIIAALVAFGALAGMPPATAEAHRSGCHRWHSCPSDTGSYVCGDLGYDDYCPNKPDTRRAASGSQGVAPSPHTYPAGIDWNKLVGGNCVLPNGRNLCDSLLGWLEANGGLSVFGLPIGEMTYDEAQDILSFPFERFRVEFHGREPEGSLYSFQLGIMGEERLIQLGRIWQNEPRANPQPGCRYFAETGHNLCGGFQTYWTSHGREFNQRGITFEESLSLFGFPITEAVLEVGSDGVTRMTQWFQRARMEDHGADGGVLLGLLNAEVAQGAAPPPNPSLVSPPAAEPAPQPTPPPAAEPTPAPPSGRRIGAICRDGTHSNATGSGACSHHGGVREWIYG